MTNSKGPYQRNLARINIHIILSISKMTAAQSIVTIFKFVKDLDEDEDKQRPKETHV